MRRPRFYCGYVLFGVNLCRLLAAESEIHARFVALTAAAAERDENGKQASAVADLFENAGQASVSAEADDEKDH